MGKWKHRLIFIDEEAREGLCLNCGSVKLRWNGTRFRCAISKAETHKDKRHGLTKIQAVDIIEDIGECEICRSQENLRIDHSHSTGDIRGVLCNRCNIGLGWFDDDIVKLAEAIKYLNK